MTTATKARRSVAALATLALGAGLAVAAPAANAAPTAGGVKSDTIDYYDDVYPTLGEDSVFETVTYERFEYLLQHEGTYGFLIGGPADAQTQAVISHIDAVASEYGIDTIYNFDPRLDGVDVDVRTSGIPQIAGLWTNLVDNYLSKSEAFSFADDETAPYFFIYNKDHSVDGDEERIVAALTTDTIPTSWNGGATASYRGQVAGALDVVAADGSVELDTIDLFTFYKEQYNTRHANAYSGLENYGPDILTDEDSDFRLQQLTYPELINILKSDGNYVIFFGGTWCHNTRAVVKDVNRQAVANGVDVVYNFDLRLDGLNGDVRHIRDHRYELSYLYGDLVDTYLTNLVTQYSLDSANANHQVAYYPGGDTSLEQKLAKKGQVPFIFEYNRTNVVDGEAAPVVQQWIQNNGNGTFTEYMTEWWFVLGLPGNVTNPDTLAQRYAFAVAAIDHLELFFAGSDEQPGLPGDDDDDDNGNDDGSGDGGSDDGSGDDNGDSDGSGDTNPSVTVSGNLVPGGVISVVGAGLPTQAEVTVELHSTPVVLATTTADDAGGFALLATIPSNIEPGEHSVVVLVDGVEVASTGVTIAAASTGDGGSGSDDTGTAPGELGQTGLSSATLGLLAFAVFAVVAGGVLVVVRRRRLEVDA